jgi:hypothetical protein
VLLVGNFVASVVLGGGDQEWIETVHNDSAQYVMIVDACSLCSAAEAAAAPNSPPIATIAPGKGAEVPACRNGAECDAVLVLTPARKLLGCLDMTFRTTPRTSRVAVSSAQKHCRSPAQLAGAS